MTLWISEVQDSGKLVVLNDGSKWSVDIVDSIHTALWLAMDKVEVSSNKLINLSRLNKAVKVERKY